MSVNRLTSAGAALYPRWIAELEQASGLSAEYLVCGMEVQPPFDAQQALDWCGGNGVPASMTANKNLRLAAVAQVRPPRLIAALKQTLLSRGVILQENLEVARLENHAGHVTGVATPDGILQASEYLLTTGAFTSNLLINNSFLSNFRPVRGQMLLFQSPPGALKTILYRDGQYVVPRRDGHILVGSTVEEIGFDKHTTEVGKQELYQAGTSIWPDLAKAKLVGHWAGLRPGSPGNIPLMDRHPTLHNLYISTGHFRYGLTMAPAAAKLMADLISGVTPAIDPTPYTWSKEVNITN